jgi:predicted RNase H-like HicB family nuclease
MRFKVTYERDEEGWWVATIRSVPGCHTQGRTLAEARRRIREALAVALERPDAARVAEDAELIDHIRLPTGVAKKLAQSTSARKRAAAEEARAQAATRAAALALTKKGLSLRDTADLLGLSHQRVQQITAG